MKNKCCLYVIISIRFFSITICNLLIEFPSYQEKQLFLIIEFCVKMKFLPSGYQGRKVQYPIPSINAVKNASQPIPRLTLFRAYGIGTQTHYLKLNAPISLYDAEIILDLLNSHDKELTVCHLIDSRRQSAREEAEEPEFESEPKERAMTALKLTVRIGLIEGGIRAFEDIYWDGQRAATARH